MSLIIGRCVAIGTGAGGTLKFEYTGNYNERLDDGVVELLSSGIIKFKKGYQLDVFLVGGGGSGNVGNFSATSGSTQTLQGGGGGAGGRTKTVSITVNAGTEYEIIVGSGGASVSAASSQDKGLKGNPGGDTSAFGNTAEGGKPSEDLIYTAGGNGGSGGGSGARGNTASRNPGAGGSNGGNGGNGYPDSSPFIGGSGQGATTREFGAYNGKLYAGGGGGGGGTYRSSGGTMYYTEGGAAGDGGGGAGGRAAGTASGLAHNGYDATDNTGGGGGGSCGEWLNSAHRVSGNGGSGIVCIRLHKENPSS